VLVQAADGGGGGGEGATPPANRTAGRSQEECIVVVHTGWIRAHRLDTTNETPKGWVVTAYGKA